MQNENLTLLYATHHVSEIEQLADHLIFIHAGRILGQKPIDILTNNWRKITFRTNKQFGPIPNEIYKVTEGQEHAVTTSNAQSSLWFLEQRGVESIETSKLSTEQICVHILRSQTKGMRHD